jgi:hypothetical protein
MAVISFDIGGVITANPGGFKELMADLRTGGHVVIVVTAIGHGSIIPAGEPARQGFSHGRLYQLGVNLGIHYDNCFTTGDNGAEAPSTGHMKAVYLKTTNAIAHVDDRPKVLLGIKQKIPNIRTVLYSGQAIGHLRNEILGLAQS